MWGVRIAVRSVVLWSSVGCNVFLKDRIQLESFSSSDRDMQQPGFARGLDTRIEAKLRWIANLGCFLVCSVVAECMPDGGRGEGRAVEYQHFSQPKPLRA